VTFWRLCSVANTASAKKRARQSEKRRVRNHAERSHLRTILKGVRVALESGDLEKARAAYRHASSILDRTARKNLIHRNTAARTKSRLNARLKALAAAARPTGPTA
jgi:small subunit ribosomal protein S20